MREILFRGKRLDNGKRAEGFIVASRENTYPNGFEMITVDGINYDELDNYIPDFTSYAVDPSTIGQCTGLHDKNGKRIFEGDIVRDAETSEVGKIFFDKCTAMFVIGFENTIADFNASYNLEVIGNIYDNPELLLDEEMEDEKNE